jgi:quercetin dioxygenase-like cupin family protein
MALRDRPEAAPEVQWLVHEELAPGALGMLLVQALPKGAWLPAHRILAAESVTFLLAGRGRWVDGGEGFSLAPGEGVFNAPGTRRAFRADPDDGAVLLVVYGGTANPREARSRPPGGVMRGGRRVARAADPGDSALRAAGGFIAMGVHWLATTQTVDACALVLATSTFTPGGSHALHRHPRADEFFLVLQGGGEHLTADGPVRLDPGDIAYIPAGEWHGFRTDPGVTTRTVYGYLGAGSLDQAGYELLEGATWA